MLIAVEGVSAAGKSTIIQELSVGLSNAARPVYDLTTSLANPAGLEHLLKHLIQDVPVSLDSTEELLLYASRLAYKARLAFELDDGRRSVVLVDRYHYSLLVLSHHVRRLPRTHVAAVAEIAIRGHRPSASLFLDIDYEEHVRRGGPDRQTRATAEGREHFELTRGGFRAEFKAVHGPKLWLNTQSASIAHCVRTASDMVRGLLGV